eukprot:gene33686-40751_t
MKLLISFRRTALPVLAGGMSLGVYQGLKVRADFVARDKLSVPSGPHFGTESIVDAAQAQVANPKPPKRRRLVVMGDSLVAGVGCDNTAESPVLPKVIAAGLSASFECEVMWLSEGIVGATVQDIASRIWPSVKETLNRENHGEEDVIFIIICGLNDWKKFLLSFPFGVGPSTFQADLQQLVNSIQQSCSKQGQTCKVFLPTLPLDCLFSDPKFTLGLRPMRYMVQWICRLWDEQKRITSRFENSTYVVGSPRLLSAFATPGTGNVSADGVHPSSQGYTWWAQHLVEEIFQRCS